MADTLTRTQRAGNGAPRKAWKTFKPSFPLFPLGLDPDQVGTRISTAPAARFHSKQGEPGNMKPNSS